MDILQQLFTDYTLRTVALGSAVLGIVSGSLGTYAVLRGQSLLGDAVSHAALPGIAIAFLITGSKSPLVLMVGAAVTGYVATFLVLRVTDNTRIKFDTALGLALSTFFGFGLVLLTFIQRLPSATQAGLDKFLFGQAAALLQQDVWVMLAVAVVVLLIVSLFWKQFKLVSFDPDFGNSLGIDMQRYDAILVTLLVVAIVIGLQTVGVVLMSAMLIAPAAAARQWTDNLGVMLVLAGFFGALSGVVGAVLSASTANLPTGPTIVLAVGVIVAVSMLLAPQRGLVFRKIRDIRNGRRIHEQSVLLDLYALAIQHDHPDHPHAEAVLDLMVDGSARTARALASLRENGYVQAVAPQQWALTASGEQQARVLLKDRNSGQ